MSIKIRDVGDLTVVRFETNRLLDEPTIDSVFEQICRHVDERGRRKFVLDFKDVEYFSSSALGKLINLHKKLQGMNGRLSFCNVIPQIFELFTITKLDKIFWFDEAPKVDESEDDPDAEPSNVGARLKPPKPSGSESVRLPRPPLEPE
jgi:anti-sigma B factor antagonist